MHEFKVNEFLMVGVGITAYHHLVNINYRIPNLKKQYYFKR